MAKSNINKYKNMSLKDISEVNDFNSLNLKEMNALYTNLHSKVKRRLNKLRKDPIARTSPALSDYKKGFKLKEPKTKKGIRNYRNKIYHEVSRMRNFLSDKTSTVTGAKKFYSKTSKLIGKVSGDKRPLTLRQFKRFWKMWDKVREMGTGEVRGNKVDSPIWKKLKELVKATGSQYNRNEDILREMEQFIKDNYEREEEKLQELETDDIFSME